MKMMQTKPRAFSFSLLAVLTLFTLASCLKEETPTPIAYLNVVHASATTPALDFSLDQNRKDYNNFVYKTYTGYINAFPGNRLFKAYRKGESNAIVSATIQLLEDASYSLFVVDTGSKAETVLVRDSSRSASGDSVRVRFANMSPDVDALDFYIQGQATPLATNVPYKQAGNFFSLKAASDVILEVKRSGHPEILATSEKKNLLAGNFYTIFTSGYSSLTNDGKLNIGVMRH